MDPELRIDTGSIRQLRSFLDRHSTLLSSIEQFVQLRVVIDVNFVVRDLLRKIKNPERGHTALEELVRSTVLEIFAPRWLEKELPSAFQQVAKKRKVAEADLWTAWQDYQALIKWDENFDQVPEEFKATDDRKDLPYIQLEKLIGAFGILSQDGDIARMGGNRLTFDFVLATRGYARAAVVSVAIRVSGLYVGAIALAGLLKLVGLVKSGLEGLPPKMRLALLVSAVIVCLHPGARAGIVVQLKKFGPIANFAVEVVNGFASIELQKRADAKAHLAKVTAATNPTT
jgi:predicted nucleic acid-binding protein